MSRVMKIVVAMDSFKGSLSADNACKAVAKGLLSVSPKLEIVICPIADGGEGTADAMIAAANGRWIDREVTGPLEEMKVTAGFGWLDDGKNAIVEMARASGLQLLSPSQLNPLKTTTYGTGELIKAACRKDPGKIFLAVGGSATVDGGVGAAMALGWQFLGKDGRPIGLGGGRLTGLHHLVAPEDLVLPEVDVLCDVDNPLCGQNGAARVFAPQKGATDGMVAQLQQGLDRLAEVVKRQLGRDIDVPRAGAAGGLAGGAIAFMGARLVSGIDEIISHTGLARRIETAHWVITGEGCFDHQSLNGKVVSGIVRIASAAKASVGVLAGSVSLTKQEYRNFGVADAIAAKKDDMSLEYAIANSDELLMQAAGDFARKHINR